MSRCRAARSAGVWSFGVRTFFRHSQSGFAFQGYRMTFLPIVERELRVAARRPGTYRVRFLAALAVIAFGFITLASAPSSLPAHQLGKAIFAMETVIAFACCLFTGVFLTADCLSVEKREGTLGLLFLTDLNGFDVVLGKLTATSLQSVYGLLAIFPMLALPFLLGGVSWREAVMALLLNLSSVCLALAAGLVASSRCTQWNRALFLAEILAVIFLLIFAALLSLALIFQVAVPFVPGFAPGEVAFDEMIVGTALTCTDANGMWSEAFGDLA